MLNNLFLLLALKSSKESLAKHPFPLLAVKFSNYREQAKRDCGSTLWGGADRKSWCRALCCYTLCFRSPRGSPHYAPGSSGSRIWGYDPMLKWLLWSNSDWNPFWRLKKLFIISYITASSSPKTRSGQGRVKGLQVKRSSFSTSFIYFFCTFMASERSITHLCPIRPHHSLLEFRVRFFLLYFCWQPLLAAISFSMWMNSFHLCHEFLSLLFFFLSFQFPLIVKYFRLSVNLSN